MPADDDQSDDSDDFGDFDDLDDFDEVDDEDEPGLPWPPAGAYPPPPRGGGRPWLLAATAVVAALAGFGAVAVALHDGTSSAAPGASAGTSSPSAGSAAPGGGAANQIPPQPEAGGLPVPGSGQQESVEIGGKVTAVSTKSITVGGPGQSVTAAVTAATKVTGQVSSIQGVKVGDFVAVLITGTDGKLTADSIQDPASLS